ncbi:39S ribosomal protein L52, mitochondrial [Aphelenchoides fujianensis]|nr:39S ribosomal protein L52, mitochondrial [Aphelenchoides fujianensis]
MNGVLGGRQTNAVVSACRWSSALKKPTGGRYQWWQEPTYVQPIVQPLQRGPDFSFLDGRRPRITSYVELKRREEQKQLGKQIVKLLKEVNEAEGLFARQQREEAAVESKSGEDLSFE